MFIAVGLLNNNTSSAILTDQPVSLAELNHNAFSERGLSDNVQDGSQAESGRRKPALYVVMAAIMASLGGLLFGYDIGKRHITISENLLCISSLIILVTFISVYCNSMN